MIKEICCSAVAFVPGAVIAAINYKIASRTLLNRPELFTSITVIRQVCSVVYLVAAYFVSRMWIPDCLLGILLGAALGVTLPSILFTPRLLRLNASLEPTHEKEEREEDA